MADDVDLTNERIESERGVALSAASAAAAAIPAGAPGECDECGDFMPRLVNGRCAPCRDGRARAFSTEAR